MSKRNYTISAAAGIVATLFSIFGSFLTKVVPPVENQSIVIGLVEFICLIILLWRLRFTETPKNINWRRILVLVVSILIVGAVYYVAFSNWVVTINGKSQVRGIGLKQEWLDECKGAAVDGDCAAFILKRYGHQAYISNNDFWSRPSILLLKIALLTIYVLLTLMICMAVFKVFDREAELKKSGSSQTGDKEDQGTTRQGEGTDYHS